MSKSKEKKFPQNHTSTSKKVVSPPPPSYIKCNPIFRFDMIDREGEFAFDLSRSDFKHRHVLEKLIEYSNMTWAEIDKQTHDHNKSKHHFLDEGGFSASAKRRIIAKGLTESTDLIFSFALQNTLRIIGKRQRDEFHVIWYDPQHKFYPSKKR